LANNRLKTRNTLRFVLDKINYSLWLARIDTEESDLKIHLIKILFLSLHSNRAFYLFLNAPPEDLSELNLFDEENTVKYGPQ